MSENSQKFKVKKGLDVAGDAVVSGNLDVAGQITVPTPASADNTTKVATTQFVQTAITNLVNAAPTTLNTLNELATALGDDPNFATTVTNNLATKAPLASPALTGVPTAPTAAADNNTTQVATTAFVVGQAGTTAPATDGVAAAGTSLKFARSDHVHPTDATRAPLASPALTGVPTAPTAAAGTSTTQLATTAFVTTADNLKAPLASPALTGVPTAPTAAKTTNGTQLATTAYVKNNGVSFPTVGGIGYNADTTLLVADEGKWIDVQAAITLTLPDVTTGHPGMTYTIRNINFGYTLKGFGTDSITNFKGTGGNTAIIPKGSFITVVQNGAAGPWYIVQQGSSLESPAFTGTPTAPTVASGNNSTQIATTAYADTAVANGKVDAALSGLTTVAGGLASSDFEHIAMPGGARYKGNSAVTGAFKIKLPVLWTTSMISFKLTVYDNITNSHFTMQISGFNELSSLTWQTPQAVITGGTSAKAANVRFGNDGTTACIWIGELADIWQWPQLMVSDLMVGYTNSNAWMNGWSITPVTVFDTVKVGPIAPFKSAFVDSPAFTGVPTAPTAAAGTSTTQLATTAFVTAADNLKAPLASPALTGVPTAPTAAAGTNTTQVATTAFVSTAVSNLVAAAPAALDTLNELATALGDDPNFATTMTNSLALKAPLASPALTGVPTAPTAAVDTNTTQLASTAFVIGQGYLKASVASVTYAPLASPALTGTPTAPTATAGVTDTTQVATTAFVNASMDTTLSKAITGNYALTAAEALNRNIIFTGALTANSTITIPTAVATYLIDNRTTGAFTLTIKMAAGTGVTVAQNARAEVFSDGSNVVKSLTDFASVALSGVPTTPTASVDNNTTQIASTAFVIGQGYAKTTTVVNKTSNTGAAGVPAGTTAQRDTSLGQGSIRFNSETNQFEGYNGTAWTSIGGGATGASGNQVFVENDQIVTASYTLTAGKNAMSAGPITIADTVVVTIPDGAVWTIV